VHVSLLVPNLLTWDGARPVTGGLERYVWQLLRLMRRLGYEVDVHQNGEADWVREVDGFRIQAHGVAKVSLEAGVQAMNHATDRVLYATPFYRGTLYKPGSLAIAHGVWWDSSRFAKHQVEETIAAVHEFLTAARVVVSCDYNFLNVVRATLPWNAHQIRVIPNFADCRVFHPVADPASGAGAGEPGGKPLEILYPRRVSDYRGYGLLLEAARQLQTLRPGLEFTLRFAVDQNYPEETDKFTAAVTAAGLAERTAIANYAFAAMPAVYREAGIVVIPSLYSEGTSFSCLEALASGCAVVASNVGGLTNLILDGFNGLLIAPTAEELTQALARLLADPDLRRELGANARRTAWAFDLPRWEQAWEQALVDVYGQPD
jgi:glycosyltransferase involved in cell wall biosynthesis